MKRGLVGRVQLLNTDRKFTKISASVSLARNNHHSWMVRAEQVIHEQTCQVELSQVVHLEHDLHIVFA